MEMVVWMVNIWYFLRLRIVFLFLFIIRSRMASFKKTYDTDSIVLRRIFAVNPDTNGRISANTFLVTGSNGLGYFQDAVAFLSTISVPTSLIAGSGITLTNTNGTYTIATDNTGANNLTSTTIGLGQIYNSTILVPGTNITFTSNANQITINGQAGGGGLAALDLTSTTQGLGSLTYISSAQLLSSLSGLDKLGYASLTQLASTTKGLGQIYNSTILVAGTNITFSSNANQITINGSAGGGGIAAADLTSTTKGLGSIGYISSTQLTSSLRGLATLGYISSAQLTSTIQNLGQIYNSTTLVAGTNITFSSNANQITINGQGGGGIAASDLASTTRGLGSLGYISSAQLISSIGGLTTYGYTSGTQLASTIQNLGQIYNSTTLVAGTNITFSSNANQITINGSAGGGGITTANLTSTVAGLGSSRYVSSFNNLSTFSTNLSLSFNTVAAVISSLTVSSLTFSSGDGYLNSSDVRARSLSTLVVYASSVNATKFVGDGSLITNVPNLGVTSIGAGTGITINQTTGAVTITATGATAGTVVDVNLTSTIFGLAGFGYVSTTALRSTVRGLGTSGYLSSFAEISSANISSGSLFSYYVSSQQIAASSIQANKFIGDGSQLTGINAGLATSDLTSTTKGLGSLGYVSTLSAFNSGTVYYLNWSQAGPTYPFKALQPTVTNGSQQSDSITVSAGANTDVVIQTFQTSTVVPSFISAGIWDLNLFVKSDSYYTSVYYKLFRLNGGTSTQIGMNSSSIEISPADGTTIVQVIISIAVPYTPLSSGDTLYIELHGVNKDITTSHNITIYYEDSTYSHLHTTFLDSVTELSTISGLGSLGYISTASLISSVAGLGTFGYLSSAAELISSAQLTSSLVGLGSMTYISSFNTLSSLNISSGSIFTGIASTTETNAGRLNFGTLYNNGVQLVDQYGNFLFTFQTL
jgi:hypothetical protein